LFDNIRFFPMASRYILERERLQFVDFLMEGNFHIDIKHTDGREVARQLLWRYSTRREASPTVRQLLMLEDLHARLAMSPIGTIVACKLRAECASILPIHPSKGLPAAGTSNFIYVVLTKERSGVDVSIAKGTYNIAYIHGDARQRSYVT
jgi:hypothetical protein